MSSQSDQESVGCAGTNKSDPWGMHTHFAELSQNIFRGHAKVDPGCFGGKRGNSLMMWS